MWFFLLSVALGASPWESTDSSISVSRLITADREELFGYIDDLNKLAELYPSHCVADWSLDDSSSGVGESGEVTYRLEKFRRRLVVTMSKAEPPRYVELDHLSSKGFVTRWLLEPHDEGSMVTLTTYINAPPWPFKGYYFQKIQPAWRACYEETLERLHHRYSLNSD